MTAAEAKTAILAIIVEVAPEAEVDTLSDDADLRDELDIDSMDMLNVLSGIEEKLGVNIPESAYAEVETLGGMVAYVHARVAGG